MRRSLTLLIVMAVAAASAVLAMDTRGSWHISGDGRGALHLDLSSDGSHWGRSTTLNEFTGLTESQMQSQTEVPVKFEIVRDAGTIHFTGNFAAGDGVGRFNFTPNASYVKTLKDLGVSMDDTTDETLFSLAMHDVSAGFIREMQSLGYRGDSDMYVAFRIHGVSPQFIKEMKDLGYANIGSEDLVAFRIHGVTPQFVREMKDLGYANLSGEELVAFRIHGVTSDFTRGMRDLGVRDLTADNLVALRIHGASVAYVRELHDLGYTGLDADDLVAMRIHGVSAKFIRELKDAGYTGVPVDKLVEMRIHGISAEDVKRMR